MLIRQLNQKNVCFVIIGISYMKRLVKGLCDDCYNFSEKSIDFKNIAIVDIKKNACRNAIIISKLVKDNFILFDSIMFY